MTTESYDWPAIVDGLNRYLRLRSIPIGMKMFETVEAIAGRSEWNAMKPVLLQKHPDLTLATATVTVRGAAVNVQKGADLLLVYAEHRGGGGI